MTCYPGKKAVPPVNHTLERPFRSITEKSMNKTLQTLLAAFMLAALSLAFTDAVRAQGTPVPNQYWWPEQLDLSPLRQHDARSNPLDDKFDYAKEFASLNLNAVKEDIKKVLTTSQSW